MSDGLKSEGSMGNSLTGMSRLVLLELLQFWHWSMGCHLIILRRGSDRMLVFIAAALNDSIWIAMDMVLWYMYL